MCLMTIFFTRIFTGRYTLHEKSTYAFQKIPLLTQYWVTKSMFSPAVSEKLKTKVVFFLSALTLDWRHSWISEVLAQRIKPHARYKMRVLTWKWKPRTGAASSWTCPRACKGKFFKIVYWKKCAFWMIRPIWNVLFRWRLKEF